MLSYSQYPKQIYFDKNSYPNNQLLSCDGDDMYTYVRERQGNKIVSSNGEKFGPYLYRNNRNGVLIASWDKPSNKKLYNSSDIGMNVDALRYYKNE